MKRLMVVNELSGMMEFVYFNESIGCKPTIDEINNYGKPSKHDYPKPSKEIINLQKEYWD